MPTYRLKTARLDDEDTGSLIDNALGEVEAAVAGLIGATLDQDYTATIVQLLSQKNAASGYAGLDANGLMDSDIGLDPAVANGTASGVKELGVAGETLAFGDSVYLKASDGRWWKTNGASATSILRIAMCLAAGGAGDSVGILDVGYIAKTGWTWADAGPLFLSETSGLLTQTAPSGAGKFVRIVGHAKSTTIVYFNPDNCWVETVA